MSEQPPEPAIPDIYADYDEPLPEVEDGEPQDAGADL